MATSEERDETELLDALLAYTESSSDESRQDLLISLRVFVDSRIREEIREAFANYRS